ncbi:hypothetical protein SKAU_G00410770 [Synaphobranchus kaupii]|uniref:Reverse transcriptase n=1 Tax=Synaphobranchus kaupii TaxID=118154 RepID=A0A9Q1E7Q0_SYNKA|nr:hypothetical protein SKAU_G00410770 [Synaphobranchus kaupii]
MPPREPTLLNQVHTPVSKPSPALPTPVAKIPATSAEASTSAFEKATERKSHPRVDRLGKASGLYLHCRLNGQACRALVDTGATISLVWPGVLHNTSRPQLPGAWTPTATPLTSVTGAKMAMRGKKEGQHHPWHGDCSPPIRPDTKTGPTSPPPNHHSPASKQATPASHRTQATVNDHSAQPPAQPKPALPAKTTAAVHALWQRSSSGLDHQQRQQLKSLLDGNADLFAVWDEDCTQTELVLHTINTDTAQPIRLRLHRMFPAKPLVAEEKKKSGDWRFCVDYRRLNSATTEDSYPLPRINKALDHISGSSWFSSLDLRSGYWQVRLAPEAKPKTAFTIGQDDLLVHASDFQQALANLTDVLAAIRQAGLRLNPKKCQLLRRETAFLGYIVSERGVATDPSKVAAVRDWPVPGNVGELRSFLGLARGNPWPFDQLRAALTEAPVLAYPDAQRPFIVDTDASNTGVGAVLSQEDEDGERVVAYYSRALGKAECNYCVTRRELLAVVRALHHFRPYLQGSHFRLRTDHASLTWLLNFKNPEGQVARWLEQLQGYDFEIRHRAG